MTSIVLAADLNYLPYVPCNLARIARFGGRADSVVLVVPQGVDENLISQVVTAGAVYGIEPEIVAIGELDEPDAAVMPAPERLSRFTYSKLLLPEALPRLDQVLYLDVDTLVRAPLDGLLARELRSPLAATLDLAGSGVHLFGTTRDPYFNAGVLRMSLEEMRKEGIWDRGRSILESHTGLLWADQDVLNLIFHNRFDDLPLTFNVSDMIARRYPGLDMLKDPAIVHFNGPVKPWQHAANSFYAQEWRREYAAVREAANLPQTAAGAQRAADEESSRSRNSYAQYRRSGHGRLDSMARAALPARAKVVTKDVVSDAVDMALNRLGGIKTRLDTPGPAPQQRPRQHAADAGIVHRSLSESPGADYGLDFLISVRRSGTNALGEVIGRARPDVLWLHELYLGSGWTDLPGGKLVERFPWFATARPDPGSAIGSQQRANEFRRIATTMSAHAVELTSAALEGQPGRVVVKVFPQHLHPPAFEEVIRRFRPRLLFLRRDLVFTYISQLRAQAAGTWRDSDVTDTPYRINDEAALRYALDCDSWFDRVELLGEALGLTSLWLTYDGLFTTGADVPALESFYPGPAMPVDSTARLDSALRVQDRRTDAAVLGMMKAVSHLSATAQAGLLRLPGKHPASTQQR